MFVVILYLFVSVRISFGIFCNDGSNPCKLDQSGLPTSYFLQINGYHCFDALDDGFICSCPDGSTTRNRPCRICDRDPNPCGVGPSFVSCFDINKSFSCLCRNGQGEIVVSTTSCDNNTVTPPPAVRCDNSGVRDPTTNQCNCPSGFTGSNCEIRSDNQLCDRIQCMSNGVCAIRPIFDGATIYQSKCLCRSGSDGDYCEKQTTTGSCTSSYCLHGGICRQRQIGSSNFIFCQCQVGWSNPRCDKQYFRCQSPGYFIDEYLKNQGKYFLYYLLQQLSCPKGLKFNFEKQLCLL
ncbi:unnamed protein product [Rotaria sp. Silwood2]|nr:unnamed protein product [Rotaria sp. Silwood2]CAF4537343.1 unnamed protein product [Rotaria sp. Silwood2]